MYGTLTKDFYQRNLSKKSIDAKDPKSLTVNIIGSNLKSKAKFMHMMKSHREAPMKISIVKKLENIEGEAKL